MKQSPSDLHMTMATLDTDNFAKMSNETLYDDDLQAHEEEDDENDVIW